ncbi:hypothetical protein EJB05_21759, partial [Eragrostis curvula]
MATWRARSSSSLPTLAVLLLLAALLCFSPAAAAAGSLATAVIVFGDSTVDSGNNNFWPTVARANFPPYGRDFPGGRATGRFCDGRLPTDFYSEKLGLRSFVPAYLDPSYGIQDFATGVCFASAGSGLDAATAGVLNVIPLSKQLDMFREYKSRLEQHLGAAQAGAVLSGAVYVVSIGSNDFLENYFALTTARHLQYATVPAYTAYLMGLARAFLSDLHALGARKIGFLGLGPIGCLPVERARLLGLACDDAHSAAARAFNDAVRATVAAGLRDSFSGADVRVAEVYGFVEALLRAPGSYGFDRADVGCCGSGRVETGYACSAWDPRTCPEAGRYVFWDAVHTTEHANRVIADYLFNTTFGSF